MPPWRPDSPLQLPNGKLVCKSHSLVVCGICTVDYSFMDEVSDGEETSAIPEIGAASSEPSFTLSGWESEGFSLLGYITPPGLVKPDVSALIPPVFQPPLPTDTPQSLFVNKRRKDPAPIRPERGSYGIPSHSRFVRRTNDEEILIYTDGACLNNGQHNPTAGCAFVFHPPHARPSDPQPDVDGTISFRLENQGPAGTPQPQTSNRAELRAVIAVLQFRVWVGEGWKRLVIATDSEYVVNGATQWFRGWERNGWVTRKKEPVKNRDLWELLLEEVRKHAGRGLTVLFWRIPREQNRDADEAAKKGAALEEVPTFKRLSGIMVKPEEMSLISFRSSD